MDRINRLTTGQQRSLDRVLSLAPLAAISLDIHGARIDILSNMDAVIEPIREGYATFRTTSREPGRDGRIHRFVALSADGSNYREAIGSLFDPPHPAHCLIAESHGRRYDVTDYQTLVYYVGSFFTAAMESVLYDDFLIIHGAALVRGASGIVLPGALRCGKTTLTLNLLNRGFRFATDDIVLIEKESLTVFPYPRPLNIRHESLAYVEGIEALADRMRYSEAFGEARWFLDLSDRAARPFRCDHVVFPVLDGSGARLDEVEKADAALQLIRHSFFPITPIRRYAHTAENLRTLSRFLESTGCYKLHHGEGRRAIDLLLDRLYGGA